VASQRRRAFRGRVVYAILKALGAVVRRLPLSFARGCGVVLGTLAWLVARRDRRRALENLTIAFPDWSLARRKTFIAAAAEQGLRTGYIARPHEFGPGKGPKEPAGPVDVMSTSVEDLAGKLGV